MTPSASIGFVFAGLTADCAWSMARFPHVAHPLLRTHEGHLPAADVDSKNVMELEFDVE